MKKILALLFVCAGLTASAAAPHVNMNAKVVNGKPSKAMVLKSNTLTNQLSAPAMKAGMTPQEFFAEKNVTPNNNRLMKKAPRRVGDDEVLDTKLGFMINYVYNSETQAVEQAKNYFTGGWTVEMEKAEDNVFNAYLYFTQIPFQFNVDYENKTAEMVMGQLAGFAWSDTTVSGKTTTICDTTEYVFLVDEAFMLNDSEDAQITNLTGELYDDGSIYIPDGWTVYMIDYTTKRVIRGGSTTTTRDTTAGMLTDFMHSTYLMTPNATHDYDYQGSGTTTTHYNNLAYVYQYDDTTAIAWNLWEFGSRGVEFILGDDGVMTFPSGQIVGTGDIEDYVAQYPSYDWETYGYWYINDDANGGGTDEVGTYTPTTISWAGTTWERLVLQDGNTYSLSYYPMLNNVLTLTNGDILMHGHTADPIILTETTDDAVIVTLELEENAEYLMTVDGEYVEFPYSLERKAEDYTVTVAAIAQVYGKFMSEVVQQEITVPALEATWTRGDVNMDGAIGIGDVTALVDYILTQDPTGINLNAADCNEDGGIGIGDVTVLVDFIMTGVWN
jgi:hypothetical protein